MKSKMKTHKTFGVAWLQLTFVGIVTAQTSATAPFFSFEKRVVSNATLASTGPQYHSYLAFANSTSSVQPPLNSSCKAFPGDAAWPSLDGWGALDHVLEQSLIKTAPLAHDCYNTAWGGYNADRCAYIASNWNISYLHADDPASIAWPFWQGRTCLPTGYNVTDTCALGGYPSYVVNASAVSDIQLAINLARNSNIRLVVKNTGHDFGGRSTGAGALSIWTHNLKELKLIDEYTTPSYSGKAIQIGAGVQVEELYEFAEANGITAMGGECHTVGVAGGYILGGGHSPLSSIYGMAADHVLSLNVVLPSGRFVTASETSNPSLFWALRGGGGSTFGVVTSVVVKAFPAIPITISQLSFSTGPNVTADLFWQGVRAYFSYFLDHPDAGIYAYWWVLPLGNSSFLFQLRPFFAPNHTVASTNALLAPWLSDLAALGIPHAPPNTTHHPSFLGAWRAGFDFEGVGTVAGRSGSRLFPRSSFATAAARDATFSALRETTEAGAVLLAFNMKNVAGPAGTTTTTPDGSAVNPHWRDSYLHACVATGWPADATVEEVRESFFGYLTDGVLARWRAANPTGGAYANEADVAEPGWQEAFWGGSYERLARLKGEVDPWDVFYAPTAVGSERWEVRTADGLLTQDGRLCRRD